MQERDGETDACVRQTDIEDRQTDIDKDEQQA